MGSGEYRNEIIGIVEDSIENTDDVDLAINKIEDRVNDIRDRLEELQTIEDLENLSVIRDLVNELSERLY